MSCCSPFTIYRQLLPYCLLVVWITQEPGRIKDVIGNRGLLHCQAKGLGEITYRWFKSDTKAGKPEPIHHSKNECYVIERLAQKHWGYYFCQAENHFENARSRTVHVSAHLPTAGTISRRTKGPCDSEVLHHTFTSAAVTVLILQ